MHTFTAQELNQHFICGEFSAEKIAEQTLQRIALYDPSIQAFLTLFSQRMLEKARRLDKKRKEGGRLGKLAGVPLAIKDNIHVCGELTTCASQFLSNYRALFDATVVRLLEEEDALLVGKTNLDEFAMGSSTEHSAYQKTKNPWRLDCTPGGSSGGSAAAVAARFYPLSLGSDTGGSIRQPASFCGVVGFKPTYGRVSRYGLVAFASSLDQIGPFATNVPDVALIMEVIGAHCPYDSTSYDAKKESYLERIHAPQKLSKIGVPRRFIEALEGEAKETFFQAIDVFKAQGAQIVDIDLDILKYSVAIYYIMASAEASANLARFDGIRYGRRSPNAKTLDEVYSLSRQEGFGAEVKRRILMGTFVLSSGYQDAYYKKAQKVRSLISEQFNRCFTEVDIIAMPTTPIAAFSSGSIQDPLQMYLQDIFTIGANLAGLPAVSVPCGLNAQAMPLGLQLIGPQRHDATVLAYAHAFERLNAFPLNLPELDVRP
jgi:aspartyl-tRNA(Asn)/glutamyl-tRNA(Gln) amidotransferase subunit A